MVLVDEHGVGMQDHHIHKVEDLMVKMHIAVTGSSDLTSSAYQNHASFLLVRLKNK